MILFGFAAIFFIANVVFGLVAVTQGAWAIAAVHAVGIILMVDTMRGNIRHFRKK
jgi:hypothetical protein